MICKSEHSDIQVQPKLLCKSEHSDLQVSRSKFVPLKEQNESGFWPYVSQGLGYVAISLFVIGEFVGAHETAVAILDMAASFGAGYDEEEKNKPRPRRRRN